MPASFQQFRKEEVMLSRHKTTGKNYIYMGKELKEKK